MRVTIDTKEDSHEDIVKVLEILTRLLQQKNQSGESVDTTTLMSMFGTSPENKEKVASATNSGTILPVAKKQTELKEPPSKIEYY